MDDELERRRRWFETYCDAASQGVHKPVRPGIRYGCPCCGYPTLSERGGYEICWLCNWEDDGQDDPHAEEVWGGPNGPYSLAAARANFKRYLIMHDPAEPSKRIGGNSNTAIEQEAKRATVKAFDMLARTSEPRHVEQLSKLVRENFEVLQRELRRKIADYERQASRDGLQ